MALEQGLRLRDTAPVSEDIKVFHDDDAGYEDWVAQHGGYVLTESPRAPSYMLHDSDCRSLTRDPPSIRLTEKPRRWAARRQTLTEWTEHETGNRPLLCSWCM